MAMRISFHPLAESDIIEAVDWYLERDSQAAERFADAVDAAVAKIASRPDRYPFWDARHQFLLLRRFPFYVAYRVEAENLYVIAIRHTALGEADWADRESTP